MSKITSISGSHDPTWETRLSRSVARFRGAKAPGQAFPRSSVTAIKLRNVARMKRSGIRVSEPRPSRITPQSGYIRATTFALT